MSVLGTAHKQLLRLQLRAVFNSCSFHVAAPVCVHTTSHLEKSVKNLSQQAAHKKKKKIQKAIVKLQKKGERILKPIDENDVLVPLKRDVIAGTRYRERKVFTSEELESNVLLVKDWARYKMRQHSTDLYVCSKMQGAQEKALEKLREESEELYKQAIQCDDMLLPYEFKGPVHTPPVANYFPADGAYIDKTNYFESDLGLTDMMELMPVKRKKIKAK